MRTGLKIATGVIVGLLLIGLLLLLGTALGVFGRVSDPDRMVGVYERFFDRCASVQSLEDQRDQIQAELERVEAEDRRQRLNSSLQAVESERARAIRQYNADADAPTRSFLRSEGLPGELDPDEEETTCDVSP